LKNDDAAGMRVRIGGAVLVLFWPGLCQVQTPHNTSQFSARAARSISSSG
jgi:hypothetical protein